MKDLLLSLAANPQIALAILGGLAWLVLHGITLAFDALQKSKLGQNVLAAQAIEFGRQLATDAVQHAEQAVRPQFAAEGIPLSGVAALKVRDSVLKSLKETLVADASPAAKVLLDKGEEYLLTLIESAVAKLPKSTVAQPLTVAPSPS